MKKIKIIIGSTRDNRVGPKIAQWVMNSTQQYIGNLEFEIIDLKQINLPLFNEPQSPYNKQYKYQHTKDWSTRIKASDGFIFVTPEYNHGYPASLKNAVDYLYHEWRDKPAAFVGYGSRGAKDSTRQLSEVLKTLKFNVIDYKIEIKKIWEAIEDDGTVKSEYITGDIQELFIEIEKTFD